MSDELKRDGWVTRRAGALLRTAQPLTRPACCGYLGFFWSWVTSNRAGEACTWYVVTCLLLVRGEGVWSCKTPQNHRISWKTKAVSRGPPRKPPRLALNGPRSLVLAVDGRPHGPRPRCDLLGASSRRYARQQRPCPQ